MFKRQYISLRGLSHCWLNVSDLLSTHEAVFFLDVDVVNGKTLLSPWLVTDAGVRTPNHTPLTPSHLQTKNYIVPLFWKKCWWWGQLNMWIRPTVEFLFERVRLVPLRLYLVRQTYQWAHPRYWEVVLFPDLIFCWGGPVSYPLSLLWTQSRGDINYVTLTGESHKNNRAREASQHYSYWQHERKKKGTCLAASVVHKDDIIIV